MPRRKDPEITEYKLKNGQTYFRLKTYIGIDPETGKSVKVTRSKLKTRKEAEQVRNQLKAKGASKLSKTISDKTVEDVWQAWQAIHFDGLRGSTQRRINTEFNNWIKPEFGNSKINHINTDHLQKFIIALSHKIVTFNRKVKLLRSLCKFAVRQGWAESNPFDKVVIPPKSTVPPRNKHNYYNADELKLFLNRTHTLNTEQFTYFNLLAGLGLRNGEGLGLQWKDIDLNKNTLRVRQEIAQDAHGKLIISDLKTPASHRILPISPKLHKILSSWKNETKFNQSNDFVFCNHQTGKCYFPTTTSRWLNSFFKKNPDLRKITAHGLRHTIATIVYYGSDKVKPKDVQYLLGHSSVDTALSIYTHITEQNKSNVFESFKHLDL